MEGTPRNHELPIEEIDVTEGWDTASQIEIFIEQLHDLPFYRPGLLYCGLDSPGNAHYQKGNIVFCETEDAIVQDDSFRNNPYKFATGQATGHENISPTIAIYDPEKLKSLSPLEYEIEDESALLATIKIKI